MENNLVTIRDSLFYEESEFINTVNYLGGLVIKREKEILYFPGRHDITF